jgi:hypothetical protein
MLMSHQVNSTKRFVMYKIEKGIPAPVLHKTLKYPFSFLSIGDAFFVHPDEAEGDLAKLQRRMRTQCTSAQKREPGKKFTARVATKEIQPSPGKKKELITGVRVWRVEPREDMKAPIQQELPFDEELENNSDSSEYSEEYFSGRYSEEYSEEDDEENGEEV